MKQDTPLKERLSYHPMLLGGMALLAGVLLVLANLQTHDKILQRQQEDLMASLSQVIPPKLHDNNLLEDTVILHEPLEYADAHSGITFYRARINGQVVAVAFSVVGMGYSGPILLMMGVDRNGAILAVRVVSHAETPGLGDKIEVEKGSWIDSFVDLSLKNHSEKEWAVKKDGGEFDQFSGATITPRAVVRAVHLGLKYYQDHRTVILGGQKNGDDHG